MNKIIQSISNCWKSLKKITFSIFEKACNGGEIITILTSEILSSVITLITVGFIIVASAIGAISVTFFVLLFETGKSFLRKEKEWIPLANPCSSISF